jgi:putative two-component system response regulator
VKGSILIVDDIADTAALLARALEQAGATDTHVVTDPTLAVERCRELQPQLLILDLRMPVMDGFQILSLLREMPDPPPVLVLTADCSREARNRALSLGAKDFLSKPYDHEELTLRAANLLESRALHNQLRRLNEKLEKTVVERTADLWSALQQVAKSAVELKRSREQTVIRLALAAELRDDETRNHVARVSQYCELLAQGSGYDREFSGLIRLASVMHDVGKIGIPEKIVRSVGKLSPEERVVMQGHAEIGCRILEGSETPLLDVAASIALTHHERYDGSGYPHGLIGTAIPPEGRIAAIADVFDALTTDRIYRRRYDLGTALRMMKDGRGTLFDPDLLDLFFDDIDEILTVKERNEDAA